MPVLAVIHPFDASEELNIRARACSEKSNASLSSPLRSIEYRGWDCGTRSDTVQQLAGISNRFKFCTHWRPASVPSLPWTSKYQRWGSSSCIQQQQSTLHSNQRHCSELQLAIIKIKIIWAYRGSRAQIGLEVVVGVGVLLAAGGGPGVWGEEGAGVDGGGGALDDSSRGTLDHTLLHVGAWLGVGEETGLLKAYNNSINNRKKKNKKKRKKRKKAKYNIVVHKNN